MFLPVVFCMFGARFFLVVLCASLAVMADLAQLLDQIAALSPEDRARATAALDVKQEGEAAATRAKPMHTHSSPQLKISNFSGDSSSKGDVSYDQWKFEVKSLMRDKLYHEGVVLQAIRRSVRGSAAEVLMTLGEDVSVDTALTKFDHMFGNVLPAEILLEQFFSARQKDSESVTSYACRLEELLAQVSKKQSDILSKEATQGMLRTKFYSGLRTELRRQVRYMFDREGSTYDDLLVLARTTEMEESKESEKKAKVSQATVVDSDISKKMDRLLSTLEDVQSRLKALETKDQSFSQTAQKSAAGPQGTQTGGQQGASRSSGKSKSGQFQFRGRCFKCGKWGHRNFECPENSQQPTAGGSS